MHSIVTEICKHGHTLNV